MALTKRINYYIDDSGYYRRIPWDTWLQDGAFFGLSPVGIKVNDVITFDSDGVVTCDMDFIDPAIEGDADIFDSEIVGLSLQTDERTFREVYENVTGFYESESEQTYEFDFDKPEYKE